MQIRAEEISAIIKEKIKGFDKQVDVKETGSVIQVGDGIAKVVGAVTGLTGARSATTRLQVGPGARMLGGRPARLGIDVTRPAHRALVRVVVVANEARGRR